MAELASGYRKVAPEAIPDLIAWLGRCLAVRQEQPNSPLWRTSVLQFADVLDHALLLDWPHHLLPLPSSPPSASSASLASRPPSSPGRSEADPKSLKKNGSAAAGPLGEAEAAVRSDSCAAVEETKGLCAHEQQQQQSVALSGATATWDPAVRQRFWKELVALYEGVVRSMCAGEGVMRGMGTGEWQSGSVQTLPPAQVHEDEVLQERMVRLLGEKVLRYCQDAPLEVKQRLVGLLLDLAERAVGEVQLIGVGHGRGSSGHIGSEKGEAPSKAAATAPASNSSLAATGSNARILPPTTSTASHRSLSGGQGPRGEGKAAAPLSGLARVGSWLGWGAAGGAAAGGGQGGRAEQVKATGSVGRGGSDGFSGNDGHAVVRTRSSGAIAAGSGSRCSDGEMVGGSQDGAGRSSLGGNEGSEGGCRMWRETLHPVCFTAIHLLPQICGQPKLSDPESSSAVQVACIAMPRLLAFARRRLQRFTEDCLVRGAGSMAAARRREVRVILAGLIAISLHPVVAAPLSHLLPAMLRCTPPPAHGFTTLSPPASPAPSLADRIATHTAPRSKPASAPTSSTTATAAAPAAMPPDPGSITDAAACAAGTGGREKGREGGGEECTEGVIGERGSEGECEWRVLPDGQGGSMGWRKAHLFAIYPFACDLILASATLSHCQLQCYPLGSPSPTSPSSKYLPLIPPPPLHLNTSPSSHHLPFI
ncbi:unnamed protein product [Closterium sp. Naga37s-1]|nr:unnamed protein product [Closterium sp. Naga37s-1]